MSDAGGDAFVDGHECAEDETSSHDDLFEVDEDHREHGQGAEQPRADAWAVAAGHRYQERGVIIHGVHHGTRPTFRAGGQGRAQRPYVHLTLTIR
ncbi:hypothetical protein GCM10009834_47430 [Streptomonospora arabica]